jgi:hypothetical protein
LRNTTDGGEMKSIMEQQSKLKDIHINLL